MENLNKKMVRSTRAQITFLWKYMLSNPGLANCNYHSMTDTFKNNAEWHKLKKALDELGPKRSVSQWKICWRDQKRKARVDSGVSKETTDATGNALLIRNLTDKSPLSLGTNEQKMAVSCEPEESSISFNQDIIQNPAAQPSTSQCLAKSPVQHQVQRPVHHQAIRKRARHTLPPVRFLNSQIELNNSLKELIKEVRRSNELREKHLNLMRGAPEEKRL